MGQSVLDLRLRDVTAPLEGAGAEGGARKVPLHLMANAGFLDDSWFDRAYWFYGRFWPGHYNIPQGPKVGQVLVFDGRMTYGLNPYTEMRGMSPAFTPGKGGYLLFADSNDAEPAAPPARGWAIRRTQPPKWSVRIPVRARAMVLAADTLLLAGPPDIVDEADPYAALEDRRGGLLWAVSTADGRKLAELKLDAEPVFDGMAGAGGRLYMATADGKVICLGKSD
jgi:hypothetical protein